MFRFLLLKRPGSDERPLDFGWLYTIPLLTLSSLLQYYSMYYVVYLVILRILAAVNCLRGNCVYTFDPFNGIVRTITHPYLAK